MRILRVNMDELKICIPISLDLGIKESGPRIIAFEALIDVPDMVGNPVPLTHRGSNPGTAQDVLLISICTH